LFLYSTAKKLREQVGAVVVSDDVQPSALPVEVVPVQGRSSGNRWVQMLYLVMSTMLLYLVTSTMAPQLVMFTISSHLVIVLYVTSPGDVLLNYITLPSAGSPCYSTGEVLSCNSTGVLSPSNSTW
jgi:23S rRNA U2552 (ribose-2'-O)-methylase RlmE/FtsJ